MVTEGSLHYAKFPSEGPFGFLPFILSSSGGLVSVRQSKWAGVDASIFSEPSAADKNAESLSASLFDPIRVPNAIERVHLAERTAGT